MDALVRPDVERKTAEQEHGPVFELGRAVFSGCA
jgi:hypothetical protein